MGKQHGGLARAGKVKGATPKVDKMEKPKRPVGRAYKRILYKKRFTVTTAAAGGKKRGPNSQNK